MGIVSTREGHCRSCFACVRNCPVKAIKVVNGQAKVVPELCIACGHCLKVCSQKAKTIASSLGQVQAWLQGGERVVACLAPSFVVEFLDQEPGQVVGALKSAGFWKVYEVALGADLVSREYRRLLDEREGEGPWISTACPAIVNLVEKYFPQLVPALVPVVSPMVATGRYVKALYGEGVKVVFAGPCIAKKEEINDREEAWGVDAVLTFDELRSLLPAGGAAAEDFDNPPAGLGRVYPLSGGLLKSAAIAHDLLATGVMTVAGKDNCLAMLDALQKSGEKNYFVDALFCDGCTNGPMLSAELDVFQKRERIVAYYRQRAHRRRDAGRGEGPVVFLSRRFRPRGSHLPVPSEEEVNRILAELNKFTPEDELNCGACGYSTCREKAVAVYRGLADNKMCLPYLVKRLEEHNLRLRQQLKEHQDYGLIGNSSAMQAVKNLIAKVAPTDCTVLLRGESGTGKDLVAQALFHHSLRSDQNFVTINCAALPENLLESELFGYVKGAFTGATQSKKGLFEEAHRGTLFLDEIGDLSLSLQGKLLRVLQQGEFFRIGDTQPRQVDVRIIAATNQDLERMVEEKRFRMDLFYRLNVVSIVLPPLRERREDIPLLARHFLEKFNQKHGKRCAGFSREAMAILEKAPWPGNVRQLENVVERAVILCEGELITPADLPPSLVGEAGETVGVFSYRKAIRDYERKLLLEALKANDWVQARAAKALGMNRSTFHEMLKRLDIKVEENR